MRAIRVPFSFNGGRINYTIDPSTIAEQKIANVLLTNTGERVMQPNYGASTSRLLFDITSPMEFSDYKVDAIQELRGSVSKTDIIDLRVNNSFYSQTGEPTTANVNVLYRLPLGSVQATTINIAIPGQLSEDTLI